MTTNSSLPSGVHKEKQILFEIGNSERQLWALIHSKGPLHSDVQVLYRNIRSSYERVILNNHTHSELQDVEYSLWKLHYKHIDEFRKIIKKSSGNTEIKKSGMPQDGGVEINNDNHIKAFKSFLSKASEFYQTLVVKLRKHYGVPEEALFHKKGCVSTSFEPESMLKCQYLCHRCLVCMGDLARYKQQYENLDTQKQNWSVAATHYLEATRIWPDSGNPQNQLAVLATYTGDDFLALYHCVRSLAVKEPFPDAWDNLILLLEKNRSSHLLYVSSKVCFDFFTPSQRIGKETGGLPSDDSSNCNMFEGESNHFTNTKLWSLIVRTVSYLFITSSLEEFPIALAFTIGVLDEMMELEDIKLKTMLESYGQMDLARKGPFRAVQIVSILIFTLKNLIDKHEKEESKDKNDCQQLVLIQLALAAAFIFMGRFVERCMKSSPLNYCPLLPSVLVFVEWCASMLDAIEVYATDQKSETAISYFYDVLVELLNQLNESRKETKMLVASSTPLWEDYELRGFVSVAFSHFSLDFSGSWEHIDDFESGTELRAQRMSEAAMKIANRSNNLQKWIIFDELGRKFYSARSDENHEKKETDNLESTDKGTRGDDPNQKIHKDTGEEAKCDTRDNPSNASTDEKPSVAEEEEVILFRPLARYNSAPSYALVSSDEHMSSPKDKDDKILPSNDGLRRTTSLLMAQNPFQSDPWGFQGDIMNSRINKSSKLQEPSIKEANAHTFSEGPISAGHPSLSAWVLDRGGLSTNRLQPIEELASSYLADLSIKKTQTSVPNSVNEFPNFPSSSATYTAPVPSAPLLPDNAPWYTDVIEQSTIPAPLLPHNPSPINGYSALSSIYGPLGYDNTSFPSYSNGYPPPGRITSSEWLHWYRENPPPERVNNHMQPTHLNVPGNHENFLYHDTYRFNQFDQWGNPLSPNQYTYMKPPGPPPLQPGYPYAFGAGGEHLTSLFHNFQRPSPFGCGSVTEQRSESLPLLEYLKEKEWRLQQQDPTLRGPTFMGN
ncbi:Protein SMG7L [Mucuna pruriens]|uniref:Protein SMG7L n=1 Tax=Mucuna pruriens TaxID=157652 RepID=A0A371HZ61_MUCPR|nr:Protein SMG7L [Mucuna pruriens]